MTEQETVDPTDLTSCLSAYDLAHSAADVARASIESAKSVLEEAQHAFDTAVATCKAKPSSKTVTDRAVAEQVLANARESHEQAIRDAQPVITAEIRARNAHEVARAIEEAATYRADIDREVAAIIEADTAIRTAVTRLRERNARHLKCVRTVSQDHPVHRLLDEHELAMLTRAGIRARHGTNPARPNAVESIQLWIVEAH